MALKSSRYFAVVSKGIEPLTAAELEALGAANVEISQGGVYFDGGVEMLYRANLWLRTASRILLPLREFAAANPVMLYDQVRRIKWDEILNPDMTFAVSCTISSTDMSHAAAEARERDERGEGRMRRDERSSRLNHSHFAALKIKDSIVDQLRYKQGARPSVDSKNPDVHIVAYIHRGRCTISLDSSGPSLHERGYREESVVAPLKETLAAAIIKLSGWNPAQPFVDPMCGSGTLPIEAAFMALNIAPGLFRRRFGFERWLDYDEDLWDRVVTAAQDQVLHKTQAPIVGYDFERSAIAAAISNVEAATLRKNIHIEKKEISELQPVSEKSGVVIVNPPYGERLDARRLEPLKRSRDDQYDDGRMARPSPSVDDPELFALYKQIGDLFKQRFKGWTGCVFTANLEAAKHIGLKPKRREILFNGPLECRLLRYELY